MRKSILRFGALALMSMTSIGAWAGAAVGDTFYDTSNNEYKILTLDSKASDESNWGTVKLVKWVAGTTIGDELIIDHYFNHYKVTSIGTKAFKDTNPKNLTIKSSVEEIEKNAFSALTGAVKITFAKSDQLKKIHDYAFFASNEANVVTLDFPKDIDPEVTVYVLDLKYAAVSGTLGEGAFKNVKFAKSTRVELGEIEEIPAYLFDFELDATGAKPIYNNLNYVLFSADAEGADAFSDLTKVGDYAFAGCKDLIWFGYWDEIQKSHFIPYTLETVGNSAFRGAFKDPYKEGNKEYPEFKFSATFRSVSQKNKLPFAEITKVGTDAFRYCTWLDNEHFCNLFPVDATIEKIGGKDVITKVTVRNDGIIRDAKFDYNFASFAETELSNSYDFTGRKESTFINAFKDNDKISEVILSTATDSIGFEALLNCTGLEKCDLTRLPKLASISWSAFQNTDKYNNVWIPNTVTFIGKDAFERASEENLAETPRTIAILSKESTEAQEVSQVIESYEKHGTNPDRWHATKPITNLTNTTLVVPMGLMKAYATVKNPCKYPNPDITIREGYDWTPAAKAEKLYTYNTNANKKGDKIYVGYYQYTVTKDWSNQYSDAENFSEWPLVKLTKINNVGTPNNDSYTDGLNQASFKFQLPQTVCAENEWDNGAAKATKVGSENKHDGFLVVAGDNAGLKLPDEDYLNNSEGKNFVFYWVEATETLNALSANTLPGVKQVRELVTEAEVQANKIDLTSVFHECANLGTFSFLKAVDNFANANNVDSNTPKNALTGWYGALAKPDAAKIGTSAFDGCINLAAFNGVAQDPFHGPTTFTYIDDVVGECAFFDCRSLENVVIANNVKIIKTAAYKNMSKLAQVRLPMALQKIEDRAFQHTALTQIRLPKAITSIGSMVFDGVAYNVYDPWLEKYVIDGELHGVLDVYAYWDSEEELESLEVANDAFGKAEFVLEGNEPKYIVRRLYIPDGMTGEKAEYDEDGNYIEGSGTLYSDEIPFNIFHKFTFAEGIIAKTKENTWSREGDLYQTGRLDLIINQKTGVRKLIIDDANDIIEFKISTTTSSYVPGVKPSVTDGVNVVYNRKVTANIYNPLFIPFSVQGNTPEYSIYKIFDTKLIDNGDGTADESIEYVKLGPGECTRPNVPYVILPKTGQITLKSVKYVDEHFNANPAEEDYIAYAKTTDVEESQDDGEGTPRVKCSDAQNKFAFWGTFEEKFGTTDPDDTFYTLTSKNRFAKMTDPKKSVKALRFYMTTEEKEYGTEYFYIKGLDLDLDDATAIEDVKANSLNAPMFDLMGRQIAAPAKGQVYIQNGVKKLAK